MVAQKDYDLKTDNCYYSAMILEERFKKYEPVLYYDTVDGHFICRINNIFYDWSGAISYSEEYMNKHIMRWSDLYNKDPTFGDRIIRDVIM